MAEKSETTTPAPESAATPASVRRARAKLHELVVREVPPLPHVFERRRDMLVMDAQHFGLETIASGCNREEDMPSERAYQAGAGAALVLLGYMERAEGLSMALLVNILADHVEEPSNG